MAHLVAGGSCIVVCWFVGLLVCLLACLLVCLLAFVEGINYIYIHRYTYIYIHTHLFMESKLAGPCTSLGGVSTSTRALLLGVCMALNVLSF